MQVRFELLLVFFFEAEKDRLVECALQLLHHLQRELSSLAGFLDLLVVELLEGSFDQVMIVQPPSSHESIDGLVAVVACQSLHMHERAVKVDMLKS